MKTVPFSHFKENFFDIWTILNTFLIITHKRIILYECILCMFIDLWEKHSLNFFLLWQKVGQFPPLPPGDYEPDNKYKNFYNKIASCNYHFFVAFASIQSIK